MSNIKIKKINDFFTYRNNILYIEDVSVIDISRSIKTPFYVYSASSLKRRYTDLAKSLKNINHSLYFSVKSNSNLAVLRVLSLLGSGMDVVSGGEYLRAQKAGVPGDKIVFSGVGKTSDEIKLALDNGIRQFNVESIPEIMMINKIASATGKKAPISIRVNPDVDAQTHKKIMTGKSENKFGIPINSALEVYKMASELKCIKIVGIDLHIGSQITDILPFEIAFIKIADFIKKLRENGHSIDRVEIGGGLGISYSSKEKDPISIDKFSLMLSKIFKDINIEIQLEPGRFISGNSGLLITSVVFFKEGTNKNFLIIDAGMNDLLRPAIYDAEHEFSHYEDLAKKHPWLGFVLVSGIGSLAGIPPFAGFVAKLLLISVAYQANLYFSLAAMIIGVAISIYYYFGWIREITFHPKPTFSDEESEKEMDPWLQVPRVGMFKFCLLFLAVISIVFGLWQGPFGDAF